MSWSRRWPCCAVASSLQLPGQSARGAGRLLRLSASVGQSGPQEAIRRREEIRISQEKAYAAAEKFSEEMREKDLEADRLRQAGLTLGNLL